MSSFRGCLEMLDVRGVRRLWAQTAPHLPQPRDDDEALHTLHEARVRSQSIPASRRAYSAAWLAERDLQAAEPQIVSAVGAASNATDPGLKRAVEGAMTRAAEAMIAAGYDPDRDAAEIRRAMLDARAKVKAGRVSV